MCIVSDSPIKDARGDKYGFEDLSKTIAKCISENVGVDGTVLSINGDWGSGKSSLINLVESKLVDENDISSVDKFETSNLSDKEEESKTKPTLVASFKRWISRDKMTETNGDEVESNVQSDSVNTKPIIISRFNCWWLRGEEALISEFFRQIYSVVSKSENQILKKRIQEFGSKVLINFAPVLGALTKTVVPIGGEVVKEMSKTLGESLAVETNLDERYMELCRLLENQQQRYLIIIDDIDRMLPEESFLIFKLIKTIGHLPYFTYLLAFDRPKVEKIFEKHEQIKDKTYLEKFVQASFDVPHITPPVIKQQVYKRLREWIDSPSILSSNQFKLRYRNLISPLIRTPRDVARVCGVVRITWRAVERQLNFADFVAIETFRVLQPELYHTIKASKEDILKIWEHDHIEGFNFNERVETKLNKLDLLESEKTILAKGLYEMFTAYSTYYEHGGEIGLNYNVDKFKQIHHLIGSVSWFDQYFQFSSDEMSLKRPTQYLIENIDDKEQVKTQLKEIIEGFEQSEKEENEQLRDFFEEISDVCINFPVEYRDSVLETLISEYKRIRKRIVDDYRSDKIRTAFVNYYWPVIQQMPIYSKQEELNVIEAEKLDTILNCAGESNFEFLFDFAYVVYQNSKKVETDSLTESKLRYLYDENNRITLFQKVGNLAAQLDVSSDVIDSDYFRDMMLHLDEFLGNGRYEFARTLFLNKLNDDRFLIKFLQAFSFNVDTTKKTDFAFDEFEIEWEQIKPFVQLDGVKERLKSFSEQDDIDSEIKTVAGIVLSKLEVED